MDELLESGLEAVNNPGTQARERGRDVEILRASAGNGIVESMKIVVNNHNGSKEEVSTFSLKAADFCIFIYIFSTGWYASVRNIIFSSKCILLSFLLIFQPVTVSSSEDDVVQASEDNSREASRKAEEFCLDSSDFLHIDEDLNLEELMKQKVKSLHFIVTVGVHFIFKVSGKFCTLTYVLLSCQP